MPKLDSNAAWQEATRLVAANRDVLFAVAGVFILLPSLALAVLLGEPPVEPGMKPEAMQAALLEFYSQNWLPMMIAAALQIVGVLTLLTLMRDRSRPTVGEAIAAGASGALSYLAAQLLLGFGVGMLAIVLITVAALVSPVLAVAVAIVAIATFVNAAFRTMLVSPVIAVEGTRNPVAALVRSWQLTAGNFWRIFGFVVLLVVLFAVVVGIIMLVIGMILALIASSETARVIAAFFSSALGSVATVYFVAVTAAIHRQLGGAPKSEVAATFD